MPRNVLLVEDSMTMRKIIARMLKLAGLDFDEVLEAANGVDALTLLGSHTVELIICDINMPEMSGLELLQRIQEQRLAPEVPIVMVTTEAGEADVRKAIQSGARGYIRKPFTVEHITKSVAPLLKQRTSATVA